MDLYNCHVSHLPKVRFADLLRKASCYNNFSPYATSDVTRARIQKYTKIRPEYFLQHLKDNDSDDTIVLQRKTKIVALFGANFLVPKDIAEQNACE